MKQHPILFSTPMVQGILKELKTKTRRTNGLDGINMSPGDYVETKWFVNNKGELTLEFTREDGQMYNIKCPYGKPGDVLWVRENFKVQQVSRIHDKEWMNHVCIDFVASEGRGTDEMRKWYWFKESEKPKVLTRKHPTKTFVSPNIFLPKECARIFLKITDIRVERLQDISPGDACDEGIEYWNIDADAFEGGELQADFKNYTWKDDENYPDYHFPTFASCIDSFRTLWQSINGEESWNANPWVWVVSFKRIDKPE